MSEHEVLINKDCKYCSNGCSNSIYENEQVTLKYSTTRSGSLTPSGAYLQYTYFFKKNTNTNNVLNCNQATINYLPQQQPR